MLSIIGTVVREVASHLLDKPAQDAIKQKLTIARRVVENLGRDGRDYLKSLTREQLGASTQPIYPVQFFGRGRGYFDAARMSGDIIITGGLVGWDSEQGKNFPPALLDQIDVALGHLVRVLKESGTDVAGIVSMTMYITDSAMGEYRELYGNRDSGFGAVWKKHLGRHFSAMACISVSQLVEPNAKVELQVVAVVPKK